VDIYELLASVISSLSWPALVAFALWMFRSDLRSLLPRLRVKYRDAELRWDTAEKDAAALPEPPEIPESKPTPEEKTIFEKLAEIAPAAAILEVWEEVESAVRVLAQESGIGDKRFTSTLGKIDLPPLKWSSEYHRLAIWKEAGDAQEMAYNRGDHRQAA